MNATSFVSLITQHGLESYINDSSISKKMTFLVPTNEAIDRFISSKAESFSFITMRSWLLYHLIPERIILDDLKSGSLLKTEYKPPSLKNDQQIIKTTSFGNNMLFNTSPLIKDQIFYLDDYLSVFAISKPLTPPPSLLVSIVQDLDYSNFIGMLHSSNLLDQLANNSSAITIAIPSNSALKKLGLAYNYLISGQNSIDDLQNLIKSHFINSIVYSDFTNNTDSVSKRKNNSSSHPRKQNKTSSNKNILKVDSLLINSPLWFEKTESNKLYISNINPETIPSNISLSSSAIVSERDIAFDSGVIHKLSTDSQILIPHQLIFTPSKLMKGMKSKCFNFLLENLNLTHFLNPISNSSINNFMSNPNINSSKKYNNDSNIILGYNFLVPGDDAWMNLSAYREFFNRVTANSTSKIVDVNKFYSSGNTPNNRNSNSNNNILSASYSQMINEGKFTKHLYLSDENSNPWENKTDTEISDYLKRIILLHILPVRNDTSLNLDFLNAKLIEINSKTSSPNSENELVSSNSVNSKKIVVFDTMLESEKLEMVIIGSRIIFQLSGTSSYYGDGDDPYLHNFVSSNSKLKRSSSPQNDYQSQSQRKSHKYKSYSNIPNKSDFYYNQHAIVLNSGKITPKFYTDSYKHDGITLQQKNVISGSPILKNFDFNVFEVDSILFAPTREGIDDGKNKWQFELLDLVLIKDIVGDTIAIDQVGKFTGVNSEAGSLSRSNLYKSYSDCADTAASMGGSQFKKTINGCDQETRMAHNNGMISSNDVYVVPADDEPSTTSAAFTVVNMDKFIESLNCEPNPSISLNDQTSCSNSLPNSNAVTAPGCTEELGTKRAIVQQEGHRKLAGLKRATAAIAKKTPIKQKKRPLSNAETVILAVKKFSLLYDIYTNNQRNNDAITSDNIEYHLFKKYPHLIKTNNLQSNPATSIKSSSSHNTNIDNGALTNSVDLSDSYTHDSLADILAKQPFYQDQIVPNASGSSTIIPCKDAKYSDIMSIFSIENPGIRNDSIKDTQAHCKTHVCDPSSSSILQLNSQQSLHSQNPHCSCIDASATANYDRQTITMNQSYKAAQLAIDVLTATFNIANFFSHQVDAFDLILNSNKHVVVSTNTSSGKSLIFYFCILLALLNYPQRCLTSGYSSNGTSCAKGNGVCTSCSGSRTRPCGNGSSYNDSCRDDTCDYCHYSGSTVLIVFPYKALSQDQLANITNLLESEFLASRMCARSQNSFLVKVYDGDTKSDEKKFIQTHADVIITNPDTLHYSILPNYTKFGRFISNLELIVIDEMHVYDSAFGMHFNMILRRLSRIKSSLTRMPAVIRTVLTSATVDFPIAVASNLLGCSKDDIALVSKSGANLVERQVVVWNPACYNFGNGMDEHSDANNAGKPFSGGGIIAEAVNVSIALLKSDMRAIVFCKVSD
ncbi:putative ATP-dependent helicase HRQ1 [Smittium culicis]|uniref:Putative ATP-dependent helicase HRQ1 n=1 Tax=Smittium culicis TaxID=133412 RepID=A0A1R1YDK7_9FUNG|nr:putative ATP-dependent helicase HRQ1 [Smittium culicis]